MERLGPRGVVATASYEARAWGVHTGMRLKAAREICPGFIQRPARPRRYAEVSTAIMTAMTISSTIGNMLMTRNWVIR